MISAAGKQPIDMGIPLTDLGFIQFYLCSAKMTVLDLSLNVNKAEKQITHSSYRRLQTLENTLNVATTFISFLTTLPLSAKVGISVDTFTQFTHCLIVIFKLTVIKEPGWNNDDVRQRADLFEIIDQACEQAENVPIAVGLVDAPGPRKGLFFKTTFLLQRIKRLFMEEMANLTGNSVEIRDDKEQDYPNASTEFSVDDGAFPGEFLFNLENEPWIAGIWDHSWYFPTETSPESQFPGYY
jgi:hypothetical protein